MPNAHPDQVRPRAARVRVRTLDRDGPALTGVMPVVVILDRLRSAFNAGNIFRLAEATRAEAVWSCGYTPCPPHPKLAKTARGCDQTVPIRHFATAADAVAAARAAGRRVYAVETVEGARAVWEVEFRFPAALVFGNEALGVGPAGLDGCDECIELPCVGTKNSINVGNCAAVVLYACLRQWLAAPGPG